MRCNKNTIVFMIVLKVVLNLILLAQCGRVKRVIGAVDVDCGLQPHVASLKNSSSLGHLCGATILSPTSALTAAHCVTRDADQYLLQLNNYCSHGDVPPKADVLQIIKHPLYNPITRAHDVAVLRIALNLSDVTWLSRSLLPTYTFGLSGECTIYGYGYKEVDSGATSEQLSAGTLRIVSLDECTATLGPYAAPRYDSGMMCAVGEGVDACQGDSGGPLFCSGSIQAVSSHGISCAVPGLPAVYTSVGPHLQWIRDLIQDD
ncbi:unnamed protein product [Spodoptera littoralis]|uniref:Peptidase S1 domain-containing protein n=1 Tax=Spodoptera littoralis TaxID=7109 RepID=A0A9P0HZ80_SPOLI|nr:unnamed protein product [Spodoptera littoralis]CAH1638212.1 unnamed protein product [Spodoptera littoralis]